MTNVQETIETFFKAFEDEAVQTLLVQPDGSVFIEDGRQGHTAVAPITTDVLFAIAEEIRLQIEDDHMPLLAFEWNALRWTLMQPPLTAGVSLILERIQTPRATILKLIEEGWLTKEEAETLNALLARRDNLVIAAPHLEDAQRVLHTLLDLLPENERNVFIGDVERVAVPATKAHGLDRFLLREFGVIQRRTLSDFTRAARRVLMDHIGDFEDLFWWLGGNLFARGRTGAIEARTPAEARRNLKALAAASAVDGLPDLVDWVVFIETSPSGNRRLKIEATGQAEAAEPLALPEIPTDPSALLPPSLAPLLAPDVEYDDDDAELGAADVEMEPIPETAELEVAEEEIDSRLSDAVSSAFADFESSVFSLDDDDDDDGGDVGSGLGSLGSLGANPPAEDPAPPAAAAASSDTADEDEEDGFAFGLTFEPGELDVEEDEPAQKQGNSRHPRANPGARSSTSRYNAEKVRQDADAIRNQRNRYRPPSPTSPPSRPGRLGSGGGSPTPPPGRSSSPPNPRWENPRSGRGSSAFRGSGGGGGGGGAGAGDRQNRWRQPPQAPSSPRLQRAAPPSREPKRHQSGEGPLLPSVEVEALLENEGPAGARSGELEFSLDGSKVPRSGDNKPSEVSGLTSLSRGLAGVAEGLERKKRESSGENPKLKGSEPDSSVNEGVELFPEGTDE